MDKKWYTVLLCSIPLFAQITPEKVEEELEEAESEFKKAKEMFNPWYTGPLQAPSAHILPPGMFNIQPYLYMTNNYARFDQHGHAHDVTNLYQLNPTFALQFGIIKWMDGVISTQGLRNKRNGHSEMNWGDSGISLGFGLMAEGVYNPALLISIRESLPSGKYQHLNPKKEGVDATGSGAYQTTLGFNISKVVWWWWLEHPMAFRFAQSWSLPAIVHVEGFNAYGGGRGTHGKVRLGHSYSADFGYEFSFNQHWVMALDVVYNYAQETTFSGHHGGNAVGGPFSDQLSLAPAIEYNVNSNFGFIGGVWFTVWGRNSSDFISGVISFTYAF